MKKFNVGIYIDGSNIYHGGKDAGWQVDYKKLLSFIRRRYNWLENPKWDEALLLAGDCDFERIVKQIISLPKSVHIFSYKSRMSYELKTLAFKSPYVTFTPLDDLKSSLAFKKQRKEPQKS